MNIAIVGAGITGISTALELARDGHQVTIYEQLNATAEDASFAPGGWLSPCALQTLSVPGSGMPIQRLLSNRALLQGSTLLGGTTWRWLRQWKQREKQAIQQQDLHLSEQLQQLATYSQYLREQDSDDIAASTELKTGHLVVLNTPQDCTFWQERLTPLRQSGQHCELITAEQARQLEPGLGHEMPIAGALHFAQGQSINPRLWTQQLRMQAQALGVTLHTGVRVQGIHLQPLGVRIEDQICLHDHVVLCTGAHTTLLQHAGIKLPTLAIAGYSVTAPVRDTVLAPRTCVMDWAEQVTISRMGQRVRITAGAELGSDASTPPHNATLQRMYTLLNDWFPGGVQLSSPQVQIWKGTRLMLPDGLPAVGPSQHPNIWLNTAHGSHGIALSAGCARALADMLGQRDTAIHMQAFDPQRFNTR
ncbi:MAG: FAD-dependent oxidoreductase [Comamonas sp.]|nr:FAD-dependent oxidoreductase [Candidatus Comamonas equi]